MKSTTTTTHPHPDRTVNVLSPEFEDKAREATGIKDIAFMVVVGTNGEVRSLKSSTTSSNDDEKHEVCVKVNIEGNICKICVMV